ncbi:hypothetical protein U8527_11355 [Kordia algicida OT-1]|uniref:Uncharacterized protein n=1 Tax=Kordia algicida OT-1 TaxID=391587 RepID=A9CU23_9FLAO|nr:hypothetical protein [Kordia algicida]EDP94172.1 hypothetical protein KAOT1_04857 [Kordia algicida OT-1]
MNKKIYLVTFLLTFICCNSNKNKDVDNKLIVTDSIKIQKNESIANNNFIKVDSINKEQNDLPIHGELNQIDLTKYYPKITDTIKDLRIIGSEKINLNPGNGILVSLLHNIGTFDQMVICTHNKDFDLIDNLYIGKATDFDNGKSHTIEYSIKNSNEIIFNQIDWAHVGEKIEPIKKEKLNVSINKKGQIQHKKIILNNANHYKTQ